MPNNTPPFSWVVLQSRRGQKELDLLLEQFNHTHYAFLSHHDKGLYHQLLQAEDSQLWDWFFQIQPTPTLFQSLVSQIVEISTERI